MRVCLHVRVCRVVVVVDLSWSRVFLYLVLLSMAETKLIHTLGWTWACAST